MTEWLRKKLKVRNDLVREFLAEFLGTFILMIYGDGSVAQAVLSKQSVGNHMSIHWSWGVGVMMGVYVAGGVSGGHINPAVSVAQACLGRFPWKKVPLYAVAQYCGSFLAALVVFLVYFDAINNYDGGVRTILGENGTAGIWATYPTEYVSIGTCLGDQVFGTAILLICVLAITDERNMTPHKGLVPISIGLVVFVIGMTYGLNCGYAINPARDLAPRIFTAIAGWGADPFSHRSFSYFWVPVIGPHVGAVVGAFTYQLFVGFHWPDESDEQDLEKQNNMRKSREAVYSDGEDKVHLNPPGGLELQE